MRSLTEPSGLKNSSLAQISAATRCSAARRASRTSGVAPNVWSLYNALQMALERRVTHKLLFGSGFPREAPETVIERIYSINSIRQGSSLPTAPREFLRSIIERDALRCLGIDHLSAPRRAPEAPIVHVSADSDSGLVSVATAPTGRS